MNNLLKNVLNTMDNIDGWHILDRKVNSQELFYIKQDVDMNRFKDVHHFDVTVYKDFEENGEKYKGSSTTKIAPTMNREEIVEALNEAAYAATFVKNQHYPLVNKGENKSVETNSSMNRKDLEAWLPEFTSAIFKSDDKDENALNSAELFLNKNHIRILNSEGVDVAYDNYHVHFEFITNWTGEKEEVELYKNMNFSDYAPEQISEEVATMIAYAKERSVASLTPALTDFNVLLTGGPVKTFFDYHLAHSNAQSVYEHISTFKIGDHMQGEDIKGDKITVTLDPNLQNSSMSKPFDADGLPLNKTVIIEEGVLNSYWGASRYAHYLDIEPIGNIRNFIVEPGSKSIDEMKSKPYIELVEFSDFQMDILTGDFAGEIRLGRYFDGETVKPVTAGSISGNIKDVQKEMYFSKETHQENDYFGPKTLQLPKLNVNGQ